MKINEAYQAMQEASGIKVGDRVKVLRKAKDCEMGWSNNWTTPEMDEAVGKTFTVEAVADEYGIELEDNYYYPFFVLEIVKSAKKAKGKPNSKKGKK